MKCISIILLIIAAGGLAGCADSTVGGDWSCPPDQPEGCFSVGQSDEAALASIRRQEPPFPGLAPPPVLATSATAPAAITDDLREQRVSEELARIWLGALLTLLAIIGRRAGCSSLSDRRSGGCHEYYGQHDH